MKLGGRRVLGGIAALLVAGALYVRALVRRPTPDRSEREKRETWRMPPLALIERPKWTRGRTTTMYLMYAYLFVAVALLLVKAVQLGLHK